MGLDLSRQPQTRPGEGSSAQHAAEGQESVREKRARNPTAEKLQSLQISPLRKTQRQHKFTPEELMNALETFQPAVDTKTEKDIEYIPPELNAAIQADGVSARERRT